MSSRSWCFTINNPEAQLDVLFEEWDCLRYVIWQMEMGEDGTVHFQGYLELDRAQRRSYVHALLPGAALFLRQGTRDQARDYCCKETSRIEGPWEYGDWNAGGQGARQDLAAFKAAVDTGKTDLEIWDQMPALFLHNMRSLPSLRMLTQAKRSWKTEVTLVYGLAGSGKSHWCNEQAPDAHWKDPNSKWWGGYCGQSDVVMDDYKAWLPWANLLRLLDKYPLDVEVKGGQTTFIARRLFITSNFLPSEWYPDAEEYPIVALVRRIDHFKIFRRPNPELTPQIESYEDYDSFLEAATSMATD